MSRTQYICKECGTNYTTTRDEAPPGIRWSDGHICKPVRKHAKGGEVDLTIETKRGLKDISKKERKEISTIIDKLAKLGKEAAEKGEKAPNYNLCDVSIPGTNLYCDDNKGIPRHAMPQLKGPVIPGSFASTLPLNAYGEADIEEHFLEHLKNRGTKVSTPFSIRPDLLKATQSELLGAKVAAMSKVLEDPKSQGYKNITAPIYISNDGYVLDGHHRWASIVAHNAGDIDKAIPMKVQVIDMEIVPLVNLSNEFAKSLGIGQVAGTYATGGQVKEKYVIVYTNDSIDPIVYGPYSSVKKAELDIKKMKENSEYDYSEEYHIQTLDKYEAPSSRSWYKKGGETLLEKNEAKEDDFPENPNNITKEELHEHFDLDNDGKVTIDDYVKHIKFHCANPKTLKEGGSIELFPKLKKPPTFVKILQKDGNPYSIGILFWHTADIVGFPGKFFVWAYEDDKDIEDLYENKIDLIIFPYRSRFDFQGAAPLRRVWHKSYQKNLRGADKLIGIIQGEFNEEKKIAYLDMMTVRKDKRRKGVNQAMIKSLRDFLHINKDQVEFVDTTKEGKKFEKSGKFDKGGYTKRGEPLRKFLKSHKPSEANKKFVYNRLKDIWGYLNDENLEKDQIPLRVRVNYTPNSPLGVGRLENTNDLIVLEHNRYSEGGETKTSNYLIKIITETPDDLLGKDFDKKTNVDSWWGVVDKQVFDELKKLSKSGGYDRFKIDVYNRDVQEETADINSLERFMNNIGINPQQELKEGGELEKPGMGGYDEDIISSDLDQTANKIVDEIPIAKPFKSLGEAGSDLIIGESQGDERKRKQKIAAGIFAPHKLWTMRKSDKDNDYKKGGGLKKAGSAALLSFLKPDPDAKELEEDELLPMQKGRTAELNRRSVVENIKEMSKDPKGFWSEQMEGFKDNRASMYRVAEDKKAKLNKYISPEEQEGLLTTATRGVLEKGGETEKKKKVVEFVDEDTGEYVYVEVDDNTDVQSMKNPNASRQRSIRKLSSKVRKLSDKLFVKGQDLDYLYEELKEVENDINETFADQDFEAGQMGEEFELQNRHNYYGNKLNELEKRKIAIQKLIPIKKKEETEMRERLDDLQSKLFDEETRY